LKRFLPFIFFVGIIFFTQKVALAQCSANFKVIGKLCFASKLQFNALDSTKTLKYNWNFGDVFSGLNNVDSIANPTHIFTKSGSYKVRLIVNDTNGCKDTITKDIIILAKPKADFIWQNGCANLNTGFLDTSKAASGDTLKSRKWDFGNSSTSTIKNPKSNYSGTGNYSVKLIVYTSAGCSDTVNKTIAIYSKPRARSDVNVACKNAQVNFFADTLTGAKFYRWDFGDTSFFSVRNASHVYKQTGFIYPILTVDFGSTKCNLKLDSMHINPLPNANLIILNDSQCFDQNNVCLKLKNSKQKIKKRTVIFDDGSFDDFTSLSDSIICHKYTDTKGGKYYPTMELIDSNNCFSSLTAINPVVIFPQLKADFILAGGNGCFQTNIFLTNNSNKTPPSVTRFLWNFGDSTIDSLNWTNFTHTYTVDGNFNISLWILDKNGCIDKFTDSRKITNTNFVIDASIDSTNGKCKSNNVFVFKQTPISGASIRWNFYGNDSATTFTTAYHFPYQGKYSVFVTIVKNGCKTVTSLKPVTIYGPTAIIGGITNQFQCYVKDTVYYTNTSSLYRNKSAMVYWDGGDPFGPQCTTSFKESLNIGKNCRYSKDSLKFKHAYQKGKEQCYYTKLVVIDTIIGCRDSVYAAIPLMPPKAKGLFAPSDNTPCPGPEWYKTITFNTGLPEPTCLKYAWWVMWDSLAARKTSNFDSNWMFNSEYKNYSYSEYAGDSAGNVSIGLIVENGLDSNGKACRDTGWFHNTLNIVRMNPDFRSNYDPKKYYCINSVLKFFPIDSSQSLGNRFIWDFGDGSILDTTHQGVVSYKYKNSGKYRVRLSILNSGGCRGDSSMMLNIGVSKNFGVSTSILCVRDTLQIVEMNHYYDTIIGGLNYWSDTLRAKAGKEELRYNLGDGKGYQNLGGNPRISYPYPGSYLISMAVKDSLGCWDTLSNRFAVSASGIYASFSLPDDSMLCGQTLGLKSTSTTIDSSVMKGLAGDYVKTWAWNFGTNYAPSYIQNPRRFFAIGNYKIKLKVTNAIGCRDSITKELVLIGPSAKFEFVGDTIGCEPLTVTFKNKSKNGSDFIWQFNDASKSAFGTNSDTNISFQYFGHGDFYPQLIARGLFTQSGISQVCDDIYPDTSLSYKKVVTLWELPKTDFAWSTDCSNSTTQFTNISTISTGSILSQKWYFGDGSSSTAANPNHVYSDTGHYRVVLKVYSDKACEDSIVRTVVVSPTPSADFNFSLSCQGTRSFFKDSSFAYNDRIYLWKWDFGDGTGSFLKNPSKLFAKDSGYKVMLKVTNVAGCSDSISKTYKVHSNPVPDFSFSNVCNQSRIDFTNNSSSKDSLVNWQWNFGDGNFLNTWNANHLYSNSSNFTVKLVIRTKWSCSDSIQKTAIIYPNPTSKIEFNQKIQCFKFNNYVFTDSSRIAYGSLSSAWDLGDLATSTQNIVKHKYAQFGNYKIRLISTSNFGCADTLYDSVKVYATPIVKFTINQSNQCSRFNSYIFTDSGKLNQGTYKLLWQFGDGKTSTANPAKYHYTDTGIFNPKLILTSNQGCMDTAFASVRLWPMPISKFVINDSDQCFSNNTFNFTNQSTIAWGSLSQNWDFGDNSSSNILNANHSYTSIGSYKVLLVETSSNNCRDSSLKTISVYPMPVTSFKIDDSTQCLTGNLFKFSNNSNISSGSMSFKWNFGDGITSTQTNPKHSFTNFGTYTVKLVSLSVLGCYDSLNQILVVYPMPKAKPIAAYSTGCINNQKFQFIDSSTIASGNLTRMWKFGDSASSAFQNPAKTFPYAKTYKVWLISKSDVGCTDSAFLPVQVYDRPFAKFGTNDTDQCLFGNNFNFTNKTTIQSGTVSQTWLFGDGKSQTTTHASNGYFIYGKYNVTLKTITNFGCVDSASAIIIVHPMPTANFSVNNSEQCLKDNQFDFTNSSTITSGGLSYLWLFGDTGKSILGSPTYSYSNFGFYKARLKATSSFGCIDSFSQLIFVNPMPVSAFKINNTAQCINNQSFIFTDSSYIFSGSLSRNWKFDDSTTSTLATVYSSFTQDTTHIIKLIETSDRGCVDSISRSIIVHSKPNASYLVNDTDQCMKQNNFVFTNNSTIRKGSMTYLWKFGDATSSALSSTSHRYFAYANYNVRLIATSENGCVDSVITKVRVDPMPIVSFTVNDTGQCINNQSFDFKKTSTIPVGTIQQLWRFGDGTTSILNNPVKKYLKDTTFTATLIETSNKACRDSATKIMDVYPKPKTLFKIDDTIQCSFQNIFNFSNTTSIKYGTLNYLWNFGDANSNNTKNATHSYSKSGNFNVKLNAFSDLGCTDSLIKNVLVTPIPVVDFSINDAGQCFKSQSFVFTNKSTISSGTIKSKWYFGDSDSLAAISAVHVYKALGNYKVKNIITTNYGCKDSLTRNIWVNPNAKPSFTINDSDQCINNQNFTFTNSSTVSPGQIVGLLWNLGNGKKSTQQIAQGNYQASGIYTILLQATTDSGCIDTSRSSIRVYPKPLAKFSVNDSAQCLYQNNYILTDQSFDSAGISQYLWNINNENSQSKPIATYKFSSIGYKNISLKVTSIEGCIDTVQKEVYIKPMPNPRFEFLKKYYCELTGPYTFVTNTPGGNFYGKNIQANVYKPVILWEDTINYRVTVNGCTDSSSQITQVYPGPVIDLGADTTLCKYEVLELKTNSWQSRYLWNDGSSGPNLRIVDPGTYWVIANNICGIIGDTIRVAFRDVNCRFFLPNAFSPNGDGINDRFKPVLYDVGEMKYQIFNRWGELLFEGNQSDDGWDGIYNGEYVQVDAYLVKAHYSYSSGVHFVKITESGTLLLIR